MIVMNCLFDFIVKCSLRCALAMSSFFIRCCAHMSLESIYFPPQIAVKIN